MTVVVPHRHLKTSAYVLRARELVVCKMKPMEYALGFKNIPMSICPTKQHIGSQMTETSISFEE